jgi:hypothetical protein
MNADIDFRQLRQCWLSPGGEIRECWPNHESEAFDILKEIGKYEDFHRSESEYGYEYLESLGWIRLHAPTQTWICEKRPTARQRKVIKEWCFDNSVRFDDALSIQHDGYEAL